MRAGLADDDWGTLDLFDAVAISQWRKAIQQCWGASAGRPSSSALASAEGNTTLSAPTRGAFFREGRGGPGRSPVLHPAAVAAWTIQSGGWMAGFDRSTVRSTTVSSSSTPAARRPSSSSAVEAPGFDGRVHLAEFHRMARLAPVDNAAHRPTATKFLILTAHGQNGRLRSPQAVRWLEEIPAIAPKVGHRASERHGRSF